MSSFERALGTECIAVLFWLKWRKQHTLPHAIVCKFGVQDFGVKFAACVIKSGHRDSYTGLEAVS